MRLQDSSALSPGLREGRVGAYVLTLVPKPGSPIVTRGNLPGHEFTSNRSVALPWVTLDREICSLKNNGRRRSQLFGDVWYDFPRVGR